MDGCIGGNAFRCLLFFIFLLRPGGNALSDMFRKSEVICDLLQSTFIVYNMWSQDSAVGIVTGFGLDDQGGWSLGPSWGRFFPFPHHPDQFWRSTSLLASGYQEFFFWGEQSGQGMKLTTHLLG
jgi:hypothetical protein